MFEASASQEVNTPNGLIANGDGLKGGKVTIPSGTPAMLRGTVLGKKTMGAVTVAAKSGGNTGNGVLTLDVTTPLLASAKVGVYTARCIAAATNSGTFRVEDPEGMVIGDVAVAATFADDVKFVIADGATDFIVGDGFDITVAAGDGKFIKSLSAAVDGTQYPDVILAEDVDASTSEKEAIVYLAGEFVSNDLVVGAGHSVASIKDGLRRRGIVLR